MSAGFLTMLFPLSAAWFTRDKDHPNSGHFVAHKTEIWFIIEARTVGEKIMATTNGTEKVEVDVSELRRETLEKADEIRKEAAKKLNVAAETIRKEVREKEADQEAVERADEIATHLEKTATYLNNNTLEQMGEDATEVVTRNPWQAVLVAFIVGVVIGLILKRR